jgi:hypothetical protein
VQTSDVSVASWLKIPFSTSERPVAPIWDYVKFWVWGLRGWEGHWKFVRILLIRRLLHKSRSSLIESGVKCGVRRRRNEQTSKEPEHNEVNQGGVGWKIAEAQERREAKSQPKAVLDFD